MSRKILIDSIDMDHRKSIIKELQIKVETDGFSKNSTPKYLYPVGFDDDNVYVPFAYNNKLYKNSYDRPERKEYTTTKTVFNGSLRPEQQVVKKEAINDLNRTGSAIISAYPGFGKCLGLNTPVLMYNGSIKNVQDIVKGELLMGDDSTPRKVLNTCKGSEEMFDIISSNGESYTVNKSHILSLKSGDMVIDIELEEYLKLSDIKDLKGYKVAVSFEKCNFITRKDNLFFFNHILVNYTNVKSKFLNNYLENKLTSRLITFKTDNINKITIDKFIFTARCLGYNIFLIESINLCKIDNNSLTTNIKVVSKGVGDYYGFSIDGNRRFLLGNFTVTHNTCTALCISTKIRLKTLIITHRIILINQWKSAIQKFSPGATIQIITGKSILEDCDYYIINAINVPKHPTSFYKNIGFLMVDEIHCIMAEGLSKCMQLIVPRYVIGLSATPYREDGLNILLDLYFGTKKIHRKLYREHTVYKVSTDFTPTVEYASNGRINWSVLLDSQCMDTKRNNMIIEIIKNNPTRVFLVLCKRVNQGKYLVDRLKEQGEDVTSLIGSQQTYEQSSRILVGTSSKAGTGFDHPRLDALILASDIQAYFIQYLGRCMRTESVVPLVFDIVDKNPILEKHYKVRRNVYIEHGGTVLDTKTLLLK
jgi:superfamily II DNA or RNA helicase